MRQRNANRGDCGPVTLESRWLPLLQSGQPNVKAPLSIGAIALLPARRVRLVASENPAEMAPPNAMQAIARTAAGIKSWHPLCTVEDQQGMISNYPDERGA